MTIEDHIKCNAHKIIQEDPIGFRRKAIKSLMLDNSEKFIEILLDVAAIADCVSDKADSKEIQLRLYQHSKFLDRLLIEEATRYARKEHELADKMKKIFFPEEKKQ